MAGTPELTYRGSVQILEAIRTLHEAGWFGIGVTDRFLVALPSGQRVGLFLGMRVAARTCPIGSTPVSRSRQPRQARACRT